MLSSSREHHCMRRKPPPASEPLAVAAEAQTRHAKAARQVRAAQTLQVRLKNRRGAGRANTAGKTLKKKGSTCYLLSPPRVQGNPTPEGRLFCNHRPNCRPAIGVPAVAAPAAKLCELMLCILTAAHCAWHISQYCSLERVLPGNAGTPDAPNSCQAAQVQSAAEEGGRVGPVRELQPGQPLACTVQRRGSPAAASSGAAHHSAAGRAHFRRTHVL